MTREITVGTPVIDQFPIWEEDGYTKKSGETVFQKRIWLDGVPQGNPITIAEIGTSGEYRAEFTPDAPGFWLLEVKIPYNEEVWFGQYETVGDIKFGSSMAEDGTDFTAAIWVDLDGQRLTDVDEISAQIKDGAGALVFDLGTVTGPKPDGVFEFTCAASVLNHHEPYFIAAQATRGSATWYANLGFAKV